MPSASLSAPEKTWCTSGVADFFEAVKQLRGEMGPTQIAGDPQYAMLRGFGGGQNVTCTILKKL